MVLSCLVRLRLKHREHTFVVLRTSGADKVLSCLVRLRLKHRECTVVVLPKSGADEA